MTQLESIDGIITELRALDAVIVEKTNQQKEGRNKLAALLEKTGLEQYKNPMATVSTVVRRTLKFADEPGLLSLLEAKKLVKYYEVVPEHKEPSKTLLRDLKDGSFTHPTVEVQEAKTIAVRFIEEE